METEQALLLAEVERRYPLKLNEYCRELAKKSAAVSRLYLPDPRELEDLGLSSDGLAERAQSPVPKLIRRYRDRAVVLTTTECFVRCRFCFRKRLWAEGAGHFHISSAELDVICAFLDAHKEITDILLSGGDPLVLTDHRLLEIAERILSDPTVLDPLNSGAELGYFAMDYSGRVLAVVGNIGEKEGNRVGNNATMAVRQPGSSIKPLSAYGPAIDLGLITPETTVMDSPNVVLNGIDWLPANDSRSYMGLVTIYTALQYSINTVAAQIVDILPQGPQTSYDYLVNHLGFTSLVPEHDIAYAPMSLGQFYNGCTVREIAQAFCSIVNDGIFTYSRTYTMLTDSEGSIVIDNTPRTIQAFEPNTAYTLTYLLQNAVEHGTGTEAALWSVPVAGKTGSSGQYMDRWFVGCTPYYVAAVWTGYDQQEAIQVSGNPAAQLWKKVMSPLHDGLAWKSFTYPYLSGENTGIFGYTDQEEDEYLDYFITTDPDTCSTGGTIIGGDQFSDNWTGGTTGDIWGGGTTGDIWGGDSSGNWGGSGADDPFLSGGGDNMFIW